MRVAAALVLIALGAGCAAHRPEVNPPATKNYPGSLVSPATQPGNFLRRQQLVATYPEGKQSFEAVLQKKDDTLTLIGLTPFGTKAFILEQEGTDVTFTPFFSREMPFPPQFILNDVQRTYFKGLSDQPMPDGWHQAEREGERISERWEGGRLQERHFVRLQNDPPGEISIVYAGGMADGRSPEHIEFDNGWFGYHLSITTTAENAL